MKAFADYNDYEIVGTYEDAGKSGKSIEGRIQKAREGKWNGGFAPYGYQLTDGKLHINEEAVAIRVIFDQYVNTDTWITDHVFVMLSDQMVSVNHMINFFIPDSRCYCVMIIGPLKIHWKSWKVC